MHTAPVLGLTAIMHVAEIEELERDRSDAFQPLPFHYIELAHMLFTHAKDTFGGDFYRVRRACCHVDTGRALFQAHRQDQYCKWDARQMHMCLRHLVHQS